MSPRILVAFVGHIFHPLQNQSVPENHQLGQLLQNVHFLPVFSVDDDEEPKDLVDDGDNEKWEEDEPEEKECLTFLVPQLSTIGGNPA